MKKRIALLLALILTLSVFPLTLQSASAATSGQCGDNLFWSYNVSTAKLAITGSGAMWDIDNLNAYWCDVREQIQSVEIGSGVTTVGDSAFEGCCALKTVSLPNSLTAIKPSAFFDCCALTAITIPNSVTAIGYSAFLGCSGLTTVTIPGSVSSLEHDAFCCCNNLKSVVLSKGVQTVGDSAFQTCSNLAFVTIPDSVTSIGYCAFEGCPKLTDVYYGGTSAQMQELINEHCDYYNEQLTSATWHVQDSLTITTQPSAATVAKGQSATFRVVAEGAAAYQWQYSKDNGATWTKWSGKTQNTLTVTGSETNNGCFYRCLLSNASESKYSGWARLTVSNVKPMVLTQPKNVTTTLGKNVTFKVVVGGTGKNYQWQYSKNNGASWTNWSGKTSASVSLTASATNNGCLYRCVVKNSYGTAWSKCARLTVSNAKPMILVQPKSATLDLGSSVTFKTVAGGTGLGYQWQYSKDSGKTWTTWSGKTSSSVSVTASATNNGCRYRCVVKNSYGSVTTNAATLSLKGAPAITTQPSAQKAGAGLKATFKIAASGSGLSYQWQYSKDNGKTWNNCSSTGYNKATFSFTTNGGLDGRLYRCVVKNSKGSVTSASAKLTVPQYRALLIGEENYSSRLYGPNNSMKAMNGMLLGLRTTYQTKMLPDSGRSAILNNIASYFQNAKSYDYSLFYYAGHGIQALSGNSADYDSYIHGALSLVDGQYITTKELADALSKINGKVIVILESCHSGSAVRAKSADEQADELKAYNQAVIDAFSGYELSDEESGEFGEVGRYGELRQSKFTVLTSSAYDQESIGYYFTDNSGNLLTAYSVFTLSLLKGLGMDYEDSNYYSDNVFAFPNGKYSGSMPADTNGNASVTLGEIYNYIIDAVRDEGESQNAQYYGSLNETIFRR